MAILFTSSIKHPFSLQAQVCAKLSGKKLTIMEEARGDVRLSWGNINLEEASTIARFLYGERRRQQDEWFQYLDVELSQLVLEIIAQMNEKSKMNEDRYNYAVKELEKILKTLDTHMRQRTFFASDFLGAVDICYASHLDVAFQWLITEKQRSTIPHLTRWFSYVRSIQPFISLLGEPSFCGSESFKFSSLCFQNGFQIVSSPAGISE